MLAPEPPHDPRVMAAALRDLPERPLPSSVVIPGLLDGLDEAGGMRTHIQQFVAQQLIPLVCYLVLTSRPSDSPSRVYPNRS